MSPIEVIPYCLICGDSGGYMTLADARDWVDVNPCEPWAGLIVEDTEVLILAATTIGDFTIGQAIVGEEDLGYDQVPLIIDHFELLGGQGIAACGPTDLGHGEIGPDASIFLDHATVVELPDEEDPS